MILDLKTNMTIGFESIKQEVESVKQYVKQEVESLKQEVKSVDQKVESVKQEVKSLKQEVKSVKQEVKSVKQEVNALRNDFYEGFKSLHDFDHNRVFCLEKCCRSLRFGVKDGCIDGSATMFGVYYKGKVARVFAPHFQCNGKNPHKKNIFTHDSADLAILNQCPDDINHVINITSLPKTQLGDNAIAFGHGDTANVWKGVLSGVYNQKNQHWHGGDVDKATALSDGEYLIQSYQHVGMSGAPVSNGCGLIGMAHAFPESSSGAIFAAVITTKVIRKFFMSVFDKLSDISQCETVKVMNLPSYPFRSCNNKIDGSISGIEQLRSDEL